MPGSITVFCNGHPEVGFILPTDDVNQYLAQCTYCGYEVIVEPVVEAPNMLDLVTAWQRLGHFHAAAD